ncbi:hypothetical protein CCAE64S_01039 [Castellaniella caeni]
MRKKLTYHEIFGFDHCFNIGDDTEKLWSDAFRRYVENDYKDDLAELLTGEYPIPEKARDLLAMIFRDELKPQPQRGKRNNKLSPHQEEELLTRLEFLRRNYDRIYVLNSAVANHIGKEPQEVLSAISGLWQQGVSVLADKFGLKPNSVRKMTSAVENKNYARSVIGLEKYKIADTAVELVYGNKKSAYSEELREALISWKYPEVYLNPLSPEAVEPGSFDPSWDEENQSTPSYPDGKGSNLVRQELADRKRLGGWWMRPDLHPDANAKS